MLYIIKDAVRHFSKKIVNYIAIFILLSLSIGTFLGMFNYNRQMDVLYNQAVKESGRYDVSVNLNKLDLNQTTYTNLMTKWIGFSKFENPSKHMGDFISFVQKTKGFNQSENPQEQIKTQLDQFIRSTNHDFVINQQQEDKFINDLLKFNSDYVTYSFNKLINENYHSWKKSYVNSTNLGIGDANYHITNAFDNKDTPWNNSQINRPFIHAGSAPKDHEIVINSYFAKQNNLKIGDKIQLGNDINNKPEIFTISGFGYQYSDLKASTFGLVSGNFSGIEKNEIALVYMTNDDYNRILYNNPNLQPSHQGYLKFSDKDDYNQTFMKLSQLISLNFSSNWYQTLARYDDMSDSGIIEQVITIDYVIFSIVAIAASSVIYIIIIFFIKREVASRKQVLGILKAQGIPSYQLAFSVVTQILITLIFACIIGYFISLGIAGYFVAINQKSVFLPFSYIFLDPILMSVSMILFPFSFFMIVLLSTVVLLRAKPLDLIKENIYKTKQFSRKSLRSYFKFTNKLPFGLRLSAAFAQRSISKWITAFLTLFTGTLVLLFEFNVIDVFTNYVNSFRNTYKNDVSSIIAIPSQFQYKSVGNHLVIDYDKPYLYNNAYENDNLSDANLASSGDEFDLSSCSWDLSNSVMPIQFKDQNDFEGKFDDAKFINIARTSFRDKCINGRYLYQVVHSSVLPEILEKFKNFFKPYEYNKISAYLTSAKTYKSLPNIVFNKFVFNSKLEYSLLSTQIQPLSKDIDAKTIIKQGEFYGLNLDNNKVNNFYDFSSLTTSLDLVRHETSVNKNMTIKETVDKAFDVDQPNNQVYIPVIISEKLAYSAQFSLTRPFIWSIKTSPSDNQKIRLKVVGVVKNDFATQNFYTDIKYLRYIMGINNPILEKQSRHSDYDMTFFNEHPFFGNNYFLSTRSDNHYQPSEYLTVYSKSGIDDSNYVFFNNDMTPNMTNLMLMSILNYDNAIIPLSIIQTSLNKIFDSITLLIYITSIFTFIILGFILIVLLNIAVKENQVIMATMKALGYTNREVMTYVLIWYTIAFGLGLSLPFVVSIYAWKLIVYLLFELTGVLFVFLFSWQSIVIIVTSLFLMTVIEAMIILLTTRRQKLIHTIKGQD